MKLLITLFVLASSLSAEAVTVTINYYCDNYEHAQSNQGQILKIITNPNSSRQLQTTRVEVLRVRGDVHKEGFMFKGKYDPTYKPRGKSNNLRFIGKEDPSSYFVGSREAIVSRDLVNSAEKGYMQIRGDEDGFWSINYRCYFKSASTK